jgi:hypothetical protein
VAGPGPTVWGVWLVQAIVSVVAAGTMALAYCENAQPGRISIDWM